MIEYINNLAGFNLSAILFALVFSLIFFIIFHFVIWPLINLFLNKILDPIIIFFNFLTNLFKTKKTQYAKNGKAKRKERFSMKEGIEDIY